MQRYKSLQVGGTYFSVLYHDERCLAPEIDTLVYLGENISGAQPGPVRDHYFQSAYSFHRHGSWLKMSPDQRDALTDHPLHLFDTNSMEPICDLEGLLAELGELTERRNGKRDP